MSEETELDPGRASELISDGGQAVDVRAGYEWDAGHIPNATHIELVALTTAAGDLDQSSAVVLYCRSGERSGMAAEALRASGWDAYSIAGGLSAWAEQGLPLEPEGGEVAARRPGP